jgi:hypothetical protein
MWLALDDTDHVSRRRPAAPPRHPSRRRRKSSLANADSSDGEHSAEGDDADSAVGEMHATSIGASFVSFAEESLLSRIERLGEELADSVVFLQKSMEDMARAATTAADVRAACQMVTFRLADWI